MINNLSITEVIRDVDVKPHPPQVQTIEWHRAYDIVVHENGETDIIYNYPHEDGPYLITTDTGEVEIDWFAYDFECYDGINETGWEDHEHSQLIAWAELPQPYRDD